MDSVAERIDRGDRQSVLAEIDAQYERLIRRVDDHIDRLVALEGTLNAELEAAYMHRHPDTQYSSDDETVDEDDDDLAARMVAQLGMPHVHFNEDVAEIESDGTVPNNFTPLGYDADSDSDSDTDTLVPDWDDPAASPDIRFRIRSRYYAADTDDEL